MFCSSFYGLISCLVYTVLLENWFIVQFHIYHYHFITASFWLTHVIKDLMCASIIIWFNLRIA